MNMWKPMFLLVNAQLFLAFGLSSDEPMTLNAAEASYRAKSIFLKKDVVVEHNLGKMSAQEVEIQTFLEEKKPRLKSIHLEERVSIAFKDSGLLTCSVADVDYPGQKGIFYGDVVYVEACKGKKQIAPLVVKSQKMSLILGRQEKEERFSPKDYVRQIIAEDGVIVNFNAEFKAIADIATYDRYSTSIAKESKGAVNLSMASDEGFCSVTNERGDHIRAKKIEIQTLTKEIVFTEARGSLCLEGGKSVVNFSGKALLWDNVLNQITLFGDVIIEVLAKDLGKQISADQARLYYAEGLKERAFSKIELEGNVRLKSFAKVDEKILHYALADFVRYTPESGLMEFSTHAKRRVLFYDMVNSVQVSAPALKVQRDKATKKDVIHGVGDVRFSFVDQEYDELRKKFNLISTEGLKLD